MISCRFLHQYLPGPQSQTKFHSYGSRKFHLMIDVLTSSRYLELSNFIVDSHCIAQLHMLGGYIKEHNVNEIVLF